MMGLYYIPVPSGGRWDVLFSESISKLNGSPHLSPNGNILTIAQIKHSLRNVLAVR